MAVIKILVLWILISAYFPGNTFLSGPTLLLAISVFQEPILKI
jgi:hypothetical protein